MFKQRERISNAIKERQTDRMMDIAIINPSLPLDGNWCERWCTVNERLANRFEEYYNFQTYSDDVFVVTFQKAGTTWIQEAAWLLLNNLDYKTSSELYIRDRSTFLEIGLFSQTINRDTLALAKELKSPRLLKTHMPASFLPSQVWQRKNKIIYCARNAKDCVVSNFHFIRSLKTWEGTMEECVEDFINSDILFEPFWPHIIEFWKMRHESNIFFTTYEDMKRDLPDVLQRLCVFLERPALNVDELNKLVQHLSFDSMKENKTTNPSKYIMAENKAISSIQFMRRGIVGSYKDELSLQDQKKIDEWTKKCLKEYEITEADIFGDFESLGI